MKIVVIGGTGLIGSKVVACLEEEEHEAVPASPDTGVNTLTGEGLAEVLEGASVVVDVSNSPSFEDKAVMEFFRRPHATCWPLRPRPVWGTTSRYRWSGRTACRRAAISARRSPRRN